MIHLRSNLLESVFSSSVCSTKEWLSDFFQDFLRNSDKRCEEFCSLAHLSGFMVYHPDMITNNKDFKSHLTEFDPQFSQHLVKEGILEMQICFEHELQSEYQYYTFDMNKLPTTGIDYAIERLEETNTALLYSNDRDGWEDHTDCYYQRWNECGLEHACPNPCLNDTKARCGVVLQRRSVPPCGTLPRSYKSVPADSDDSERCYDHLEMEFNPAWLRGLRFLRLLEYSWVLFALPGVFAGCYFLKRGQTGNQLMGPHGMNQMGMMAMVGQNEMTSANFGNQPMQQPPPPPGPGMQSPNQWTNQAAQPQLGIGYNTAQVGNTFAQSTTVGQLPLHGGVPMNQFPPATTAAGPGFVSPPQFPPMAPTIEQAQQGIPGQQQFPPPPPYNDPNSYNAKGFF